MMKPPLTKVEMIERSMSCFRFGLLGLLPVIGIPFAILACLCYHRVKSSQAGVWNPAHRELRWGSFCARLGLLLFLVVPLAIITCVVSSGYARIGDLCAQWLARPYWLPPWQSVHKNAGS